MDLKIDYAFKKLFAKPGNEPILLAFVNAALDPSEEERVTWIELVNNEQSREHIGDKMSVLDLLARTERGMYVNIEIQLANEHDMERRSLYYWSRVYTGQMSQGMSYQELKRTITINILNFRYMKQMDDYHTRFHVAEDEDGFKLTEVLEMHFMELPKLMDRWQRGQASPEENLLARWLLLLEADDHEDIRERLWAIAKEDEAMKKAFEQWEEVSQDVESWAVYEHRRKVVMDELAKVREAELRELAAHDRGVAEGLEQGIEQGLEQGIEQSKRAMARRLIAKGVEVELIAEVTGLSLAVIEALRSELN